MENVAIKGRGGNDVQHNWKGKILRIWITIIRHGLSVTSVNLKKAGMAGRNIVIKNNTRYYLNYLFRILVFQTPPNWMTMILLLFSGINVKYIAL